MLHEKDLNNRKQCILKNFIFTRLNSALNAIMIEDKLQKQSTVYVY